MTDRELLEKAAKAAGIDVEWLLDFENKEYLHNWEDGCVWNPLTDDGDALKLAVKLRLRVCTPTTDLDCAIASNGDVTKYSQDDVEGELMRDLYAATRRAIVRAAAAIGETL